MQIESIEKKSTARNALNYMGTRLFRPRYQLWKFYQLGQSSISCAISSGCLLRKKYCFAQAGKLLHRRDAFYRLFCTKNDGMRRVWECADKIIVIDMKTRPLPEKYLLQKRGRTKPVKRQTFRPVRHGSWFIHDLIYGTDNAIEDEPVRLYPKVLECKEQRRLSPEQSAARKVTNLLRLLSHVTPRDCYASTKCWFGSTVEWLVIQFQIKLGPFDYNAMHRIYNLEYTTDSKRGWLQHRRAHDAIRLKTIDAIRKLANPPSDPLNPLIVTLQGIADELDTWPDMEDEHGHQIDMVSHKAGWHDWLRYAYNEMLHAIEWGDARNNLKDSHWATLAETLFPDELKSITERRIGQIVRDVEKTYPERRQRRREILLAKEAKLKAAREKNI